MDLVRVDCLRCGEPIMLDRTFPPPFSYVCPACGSKYTVIEHGTITVLPKGAEYKEQENAKDS